jgi:hypothetical protein
MDAMLPGLRKQAGFFCAGIGSGDSALGDGR